MLNDPLGLTIEDDSSEGEPDERRWRANGCGLDRACRRRAPHLCSKGDREGAERL